MIGNGRKSRWNTREIVFIIFASYILKVKNAEMMLKFKIWR